MSVEISMLVWSIILGIVQIALAASFSTKERGLMWNLGPRDDVPKPLGKTAARLDRTSSNFLETFAFFAAAVLIVEATGKANATSALGAQLYFWGRLAYLPLYAFGIPVARTVAWTVSLVGIVMVLYAICPQA